LSEASFSSKLPNSLLCLTPNQLHFIHIIININFSNVAGSRNLMTSSSSFKLSKSMF
jgi:hypothetical protein